MQKLTLITITIFTLVMTVTFVEGNFGTEKQSQIKNSKVSNLNNNEQIKNENKISDDIKNNKTPINNDLAKPDLKPASDSSQLNSESLKIKQADKTQSEIKKTETTNSSANKQVKKSKPAIKDVNKKAEKTKNKTNNNYEPKKPIKHLNSPNININNLKSNLTKVNKDSLNLNEISKHNTKSDCYLVINNNVYNVSSYISYHPGGSRAIISRCGKEVTGIFAQIHSNRAWDLLKKYKIGSITTHQNSTYPEILNAISKALKNANPSAWVIKVSPRKNLYLAKVVYDKKLYELHIDSNGKIIKEEIADDEANWSLWENDSDDKI